jgi:site-specific DNA-methyltransferase (adenine-specific)
MSESFHDGRIILHCGDCIEVMKQLEDNSIDSIVCDPPYHLTSIVKRFGAKDAAPAKPFGSKSNMENKTWDKPNVRLTRGFMGCMWDGGDIAFRPDVWREALRVLKPGGHLLAFGGTRTYHRLACAIEDAGFEIRDTIMWVYASGFPKSRDISKAIDKEAGAEREIVGEKKSGLSNGSGTTVGRFTASRNERGLVDITAPATDAAKQWDGWGTTLKPAVEPIVMMRKPISETTIAANVLHWGTGALNIDICRIGDEQCTYDLKGGENLNCLSRLGGNDREEARGLGAYGVGAYSVGAKQISIGTTTIIGRWPANLIHDGSPEVLAAFPEIGRGCSAARFFYTAKADDADRIARYVDGKRHGHPTCKPVDLMQYLVRLVTPPGGTILDPFAGSGTTGEAAFHEGFHAVLIEKEIEYQNDIRHRMQMMHADRMERKRVHKNPSASVAKCVWE